MPFASRPQTPPTPAQPAKLTIAYVPPADQIVSLHDCHPDELGIYLGVLTDEQDRLLTIPGFTLQHSDYASSGAKLNDNVFINLPDPHGTATSHEIDGKATRVVISLNR